MSCRRPDHARGGDGIDVVGQFRREVDVPVRAGSQVADEIGAHADLREFGKRKPREQWPEIQWFDDRRDRQPDSLTTLKLRNMCFPPPSMEKVIKRQSARPCKICYSAGCRSCCGSYHACPTRSGEADRVETRAHNRHHRLHRSKENGINGRPCFKPLLLILFLSGDSDVGWVL